MRRREFIGVLGGAAAWPLTAGAQTERMRQVDILMGSADNPEARLRLNAFLETFRELGWIEGQNVRLEIRWGENNRRKIETHAEEMVLLKPDVIFVIFVNPTYALLPVRKKTQDIPIVFASVSDPVGQGIVKSLARPSGNVTGFSALEFSIIGKWLQLLKEVAPGLRRVGLMISTINAVSPRWYEHFNAIAPKFAIEPIAIPIQDRTADIENAVKTLAAQPGSALIVPGDTFVDATAVRQLIISLTATYRLPAIYLTRAFAVEGGLMSYGIDRTDPFRRAASYVDRILKGERPADLPVQQPTKFHFLINLKTAKLLGLDPPGTLVATADEVIE